MASDIEICNFALSHLGISTEIATLTERSKEAQACNRFYANVRDEVLRDFVWPFATATVTPALVTDYTLDPTTAHEWNYSYRLPPTVLKVHRIHNGVSRRETRQSRIPFRLGRDNDGLLLFTDQPTPVVEYTEQITDAAAFSVDVAQTIALLLAAYIAPRVTGGDPMKLGQRALSLYDWKRQRAQVNALAEETADQPRESELVEVRNGPRHFHDDGGYGDCR